MYSDVNVELKDSEREGNQVKDDAQATVTATPATQKTKVPLQSSSISSDYATKFLNFDNIPSSDTKIISMMDVKVQHEDPSIQTPPLLTVPVTEILETSTASATTTPPPILPFISLQQQSTPIPTPTTTKVTTPTTVVPDSETLSAVHLRVSNLEKEVKELKNIDHSSALCATIKSEVSTAVKEYLGTSLDDALYKVKMEQAGKQQETGYTITSSNLVKLQEFDQKMTLFETMTKTKSFNKNTKYKALYHALIESILEYEDAMEKGVANKSKKRNPDDADRYEGPPARPNQGLKRKKTCKDTKPLKKAMSTGTSKGTTKSQPKSTGNDLAKAEKPPKTLDDLMITLIDFSAFVMNRLQISDLTQDILVGLAYNILKVTCRSYVELEYNMEECYKALTDPEGDRYPFDLSKPLPLVQSSNRQIVPVNYFFNNDLAYLQGESTSRKYTTSLTMTKAAKYDLPRIENMVPNLWIPIKVAYDKHALLDMPLLVVQNRLFNLKGEDMLHLAAALRNKMYCNPKESGRSSTWYRELPKEAQHIQAKNTDGTLQSVRDTLHDMATNLRMGYNKTMPKRIWSHLDKTRSHIMVKEIDRQLWERRLMRSLEKFVGGRHYGEDLRLLQRTI
ncbi:hypothetical protein Tco_1177645 [Tanacetum coccineum]